MSSCLQIPNLDISEKRIQTEPKDQTVQRDRPEQTLQTVRPTTIRQVRVRGQHWCRWYPRGIHGCPDLGRRV